MKKRPIEERFWEKVEKTDSCWLWLACKDSRGYGILRHKGRNLKAHRVSMEIHLGYASELCVLHHCDNPSCVNPEHLFLGTFLDNSRDRDSKGRAGDFKGEKSYWAKLSEAQVLIIRQRYVSENITRKQLAKEFGISVGGLSSIVSGETWKHLPVLKRSKTSRPDAIEPVQL